MDLVVLLNPDGTEAGAAPKAAVHVAPGRLHRAFSVLLFDSQGRLLLQRRARTKALFAGLWSNSCCSHPRPGEAVIAAGRRRVREELAVDCTLEEVGELDYHAHDAASGLAERERVHVLTGLIRTPSTPDSQEISDLAFVTFDTLVWHFERNPGAFSPWLPLAAVAARPWWEATFVSRLPEVPAR